MNIEQYQAMSDSPERIRVEGSFAPNSTSAVDATASRGDKHWTVAYISTGLFRVTFNSTFKFTAAQLEYADAHLQLASAGDQYAQCGSYDADNRTLDIRVIDCSAAAVADISANANNRISFVVVVRNTILTP